MRVRVTRMRNYGMCVKCVCLVVCLCDGVVRVESAERRFGNVGLVGKDPS